MNCPYCDKPAEWVPNEHIYGKRYGRSYMCYLCKPCNAHVGCHNNTKKPLGTMANKQLRTARMKAHAAIDPLWKSGRMKRGVVYARLAKHLGREVHVGEADLQQCAEIIAAVPFIMDDLQPGIERLGLFKDLLEQKLPFLS